VGHPSKHYDGEGHDTGVKEFFSGTVSGDVIRFTYQLDGGLHTIEFVANGIAPACTGESNNSK
jgi:hypothetical protein